MRDPAGEPADGLHLLRVPELLLRTMQGLLGPLALGEIEPGGLEESGARDRERGELGQAPREIAIVLIERRLLGPPADERNHPERAALRAYGEDHQAVDPDPLDRGPNAPARRSGAAPRGRRGE